MYYGLVVIAVVMFGLQFLANDEYQKQTGSGFFQANLFKFLGCVLGLPVLLAINGFRVEFTPFTLLMSCVNFLNGLLFILCALKAFERVNLSVFSLLSMLGGMLLPLLAGIFFFHETMTWGIGLCVVFTVSALALTIEKGTESEKKKKGGWVFYIGVFLFNGMSGVISKIYTEASFNKASNAGYSILTSMVTLVVTAIFVACLWKKRPRITKKSFWCGTIAGPLSDVANYLLLLALAVLPASVNYPMVTGGTIIVSTLLGYCTKQKPKIKEWISVTLAFVGIVCLTLL